MSKRINAALSKNICARWEIPFAYHAFPIQLRPPTTQPLDPELLSALHVLSEISQGQIEEVHKLLREAVLRRGKAKKEGREKTFFKAAVTVEDINAVKGEFEKRSKESPGHAAERLPSRPGALGTRKFMKSVRFAENARKAGRKRRRDVDDVSEEDGEERSEQSSSEEKVVPETPPLPPQRPSSFYTPSDNDPNMLLQDMQQRTRSHSFAQSDHSLPSSPPSVTQPTNADTRSPSSPRHGRPVKRARQRNYTTEAYLDQKHTEAQIHELSAEMYTHRQKAEEYMGRAAEHKRRALQVQLEIEQLEKQMG